MNLSPGAHIHLIGICGTAMASLAGLLQQKGFKVSGSDSNPYPPMSTQVESLGIKIANGYHSDNVNGANKELGRPDFVIVGNVVTSSNPEAQEVVRLGIPSTSLAQAVGEWVIGDHECVNISGTHGKTTTTALMSWVLDVAGEKPGYLIGGIPKNFQQSFRNPSKKFFVIEGDEYDTAYFDKVPKFVHYKPRHVIFTSCEFDHADIYQDLNAVKEAFRKLMGLIPAEGTLVYWAENSDVAELSKESPVKMKLSYGIKKGDFQARRIKYNIDSTEFDVVRCIDTGGNQVFEEVIGHFKMMLPGEYNILNALAVIVLGLRLGLGTANLNSALLSFAGVKRRQEILGSPRNILVIEDFAHHPTAVAQTISGIKKRYPGKKVHCVFEPRSATSRRRVFQDAYVESFGEADEVIVMKPFDQTKINIGDRFSSDELSTDLMQKGIPALVFDSVELIVEYLKLKVQPGEIILLMSNGGFGGIYQKLLASLNE